MRKDHVADRDRETRVVQDHDGGQSANLIPIYKGPYGFHAMYETLVNTPGWALLLEVGVSTGVILVVGTIVSLRSDRSDRQQRQRLHLRSPVHSASPWRFWVTSPT
jgi:hypothetical protein